MVYSFIDGPELLSPSTLKNSWRPNFESFLRIRFPEEDIPFQKTIIQLPIIKNILRVLKQIAVDYHGNASANPMFQKDVERLVSVMGFSSKDLSDKLVLYLLHEFGMRFIDLQRYRKRDFKLNTRPAQIRMISTKNGTHFHTWAVLPSFLTDRLREFFKRIHFEDNDYVFCYSYRNSEQLVSVQGKVKYFTNGHSVFSKTLDVICKSAGYPDRFFTPHSGGHGMLTERVIQAHRTGKSIQDALDHVCLETGRWKIGSQAILRYISPAVIRISSMLESKQTLDDLPIETIHNISMSEPYQRMSHYHWNADDALLKRVLGNIVQVDEKTSMRDHCLRVCTILLKGTDQHTSKFIQWTKSQVPRHEGEPKKKHTHRFRVYISKILPTLIMMKIIQSPTPGICVVGWPLPGDVQYFLELPTKNKQTRSHKKTKGSYGSMPEMRDHDDENKAKTDYMKKRKMVPRAVLIESKGNSFAKIPNKYKE